MSKIFGTHDEQTIQQLERCVAAEEGAIGVLCADGHLGYSMPIGGVVGYKKFISPSGVGYDIGCGNYAVQTDISISDLQTDLSSIADEIVRRVSFGIGRVNNEKVDHPVLERIANSPVKQQKALLQLAANQLGTVGSGNHYVDVLFDGSGYLWVGVHFGSRGFGHKTASMFMNAAQGLKMEDKVHDGEMNAPALLFHVDNPVGQDYIEAMQIAGAYAAAGREVVVGKVLEILGAHATYGVHNHHNFAWHEQHNGEWYWVVRKGATPARPGQEGFVGGSMGDISVILEGVESAESKAALYSTVHGAGRLISRRKAAGKWKKGVQVQKGLVDFDTVKERIRAMGIQLRGAGPDEAPEVYRSLRDVLDAHKNTILVKYWLSPAIVVMAGADVHDPFKD